MPSLQPYIGAKRLFCAPACQTQIRPKVCLALKPKFGPKVCLAPPRQTFNLTLGQNACFALPHVKLETQIRAKGLSSPTMPRLQPYTLVQNACFALPHVKLETQILAKGLSSPTMPRLQPYTLGQNACFALPHVKLETQIRTKGLSSPTMPSLQPYIGAKRLFCAPACQT